MLPTRTEVPELYTGMWSRFRATLLDLVVVWVAFFAAWIGVTSILPVAKPYIGSIYFYLPMLFVGWLYSALLESSRLQATLGKLAIYAHVTDTGGARIGFGRASGRYLGKLLSAATLGVGFLIADVTARRQALHDLLAHTAVVQKKPLRTWQENGALASVAPARAWTKVQTVKASLGLGFSLLILASLGYCMDVQISTSNEVREFCTSIKPGTGGSELERAIAARNFHRVDIQAPDGVEIRLRHRRSIYPNICDIVVQGGKVKSAEFIPYD